VWYTLLVWKQARELECITEHKHDEGAHGGVTGFGRGIDLGGAAKVLDEAFHPGHVLEVVEHEFLGLGSQINVKLSDFSLDGLASFGHESLVIEDLRPLSPCVLVSESSEHEEPELQGSDGPFRVDGCLDPVFVLDLDIFDDINAVLCDLTEFKGSQLFRVRSIGICLHDAVDVVIVLGDGIFQILPDFETHLIAELLVIQFFFIRHCSSKSEIWPDLLDEFAIDLVLLDALRWCDDLLLLLRLCLFLDGRLVLDWLLDSLLLGLLDSFWSSIINLLITIWMVNDIISSIVLDTTVKFAHQSGELTVFLRSCLILRLLF